MNELLAEARTGDIILMSGNGAVSDIVRLGSESEFSHVAIVIRKSMDKEPFLFQSTIDRSLLDLQSKTHKEGPQISLLRTAVESYDGHTICYRKLNTGLKKREAGELRKRWTDELWNFQKEVNHLTYENHLDELAESALGITKENDRSSYFCTELVADCLVRMGLIDDSEGSPVNSYTLDNFTSRFPIILKGTPYYEIELEVQSNASRD